MLLLRFLFLYLGMARIFLGRVNGYSAYETWTHLPGNEGKSEDDFFEFLKSTEPGPKGDKGDKGDKGPSAYGVWLDVGHEGSVGDFLDSLKVYATVKTNSDTEYVLTISNGGVSFDTPNLKGDDALGDVVIVSAASEFPAVGDEQTAYIALDSKSIYVWSGAAYVLAGSGDYDNLAHRPAIGGVVLSSSSTPSGLGLVVSSELQAVSAGLSSHKTDYGNPHNVSASQVGLGNVDNTSDTSKPVSTAQQAALDEKVDKVAGKGLSSNDFSDGYRSQLDNAPENISEALSNIETATEGEGLLYGLLSASTVEEAQISLVKGDGSDIAISLADLANILLQRSFVSDNGGTSLSNSASGFSALSGEIDTNSVAGFSTNTESGNPAVAGFSLSHNMNMSDSVHVLLMNNGTKKSAYLLKNKEPPAARGQVSAADEMLNKGEIETAINNIVAAAISGVLPVPLVLAKESSLPNISGGSTSVQYFVVEDMDITSTDVVRQGRAWCGVGETSWHVLLDLVNVLSTDVFEQSDDGEWVLAEAVRGLIDGAVQGSQILTSEPSSSVTDSQVVSAKRVWSMFGAALSTLATTAKTVVGAINELVSSVAAKYTKPTTGIPVSDLNLTTAQQLALNSGVSASLLGFMSSDIYNKVDKNGTDRLMTAAEGAKLSGIAYGAQVNPGVATTSAAGLMSGGDKTKLDGYPSVGEGTDKFLREDGTWDTISVSGSDNSGITQLTGDVTAPLTTNGSAVATLAASGVTAGTYGDGGSTRTLDFGSTFKVPKTLTVDAKGRVTAAEEITLTMPAEPTSGSGSANHYGVCSTAADTAEKTVAISGFSLVTGAEVTVKFTETNTAYSPTLNVNGTGAKNVSYKNAPILSGVLAAGRTFHFVFDGTKYEIIGSPLLGEEVGDYFGMVVNSGSDSNFILPLRYGSGTAHHDLRIDWGDGEVVVFTGNVAGSQYQGFTHAYPLANSDYEIKITGTTYLDTAENSSYFGLGFHSSSSGCNVATNKAKVKKLLGSLESLVSPNMSSRSYCYNNMFYNCSGLTSIPATLLPASALADYCYSNMFRGCSGLTSIPTTLLPASALEISCYSYMFSGCSGLKSLPATLLPASTLTWYCYQNMFQGCSGLTSIPATLLPASALADYCYQNMFYGCTGLTSIPATLLPATTLAQSCYNGMFRGCSGLTSIPAPLLPATTLAQSCYQNMFYGCTGLTSIPATLLPATTIMAGCYQGMFNNCINLVYIYMTIDWFSKTPAQSYMFLNCTNITSETSYANIPSDWK
jgi:hypothetical protein